jgi:hypothetical protein
MANSPTGCVPPASYLFCFFFELIFDGEGGGQMFLRNISLFQNTQRYNPEDHTFQIRCWVNLKSNKNLFVYRQNTIWDHKEDLDFDGRKIEIDVREAG